MTLGTPLTDVREHINILYYGDGGSGKTTSLARMANLGKILMVNAEGGIKQKPLREHGVKVENISIYPGPGEEFDFQALEDMFWTIKAELAADPDSWTGVVWDSATELYQMLLGGIVEYQNDKAERLGKSRVKDTEAGDLISRFFVDISDYGVMTEQMRLLIRRFRDLPCHFGVSALERRDKDNDGAVQYGPAVTPALMNDLFGYMDIVCHANVSQFGGVDEYRGAFRKIGTRRAKDRFGAMPRILIDPFFDRVAAYVEEDLDMDTDPVMALAKKRREEAAAKEAAAAASTSDE